MSDFVIFSSNIYLSISLSLYPSIYPSIQPASQPASHPFIRMSVCLSVCLSVCVGVGGVLVYGWVCGCCFSFVFVFIFSNELAGDGGGRGVLTERAGSRDSHPPHPLSPDSHAPPTPLLKVTNEACESPTLAIIAHVLFPFLFF